MWMRRFNTLLIALWFSLDCLVKKVTITHIPTHLFPRSVMCETPELGVYLFKNPTIENETLLSVFSGFSSMEIGLTVESDTINTVINAYN